MPVTKMLSSLDKIPAKIILILSTILLAPSCTTISEQANNKFSEQYGKQVEKINQRRLEMDPDYKPKCSFLWFGCNKKNINAEHQPGEMVTPDMNTYSQGQSTPVLPDDMFDISYNLENEPASYQNAKLSFDDITIPATDAFGIRTDLGDKNYILVSNQALQQNVDFIKDHQSKEDKEVSADLIKEQKEVRRRKYLNLPPKSQKSDDSKEKTADNKDTKNKSENSSSSDNKNSDNKTSDNKTDQANPQANTQKAPEKSGGLTRVQAKQ